MPTVPEPPAELTVCAPAPAVPDARAADGPAIGVFIRQLEAAGADCRRTVGELAAWLREAKARVEAGR